MLAAALFASLALAAPSAPQVVAGGVVTKVGKLSGHVLAPGEELVLEVEGPTALVLEIRVAKPGRVVVTLARDDGQAAEARLALKPDARPKAPGYAAGARVGVMMPAGVQRVHVTSSLTALVAASCVAKLPKNVLAVQWATAVSPDSGAAPADAGVRSEASGGSPSSAEESSLPSPPRPAPEAPASPASQAALEARELAHELEARRETLGPAVTSAASDAPLRVAVYDYELAGIDKTIGAVVTNSTLAEVRKLIGVSAIGMNEIQDMLSHETTKQLMGCDDQSCLAEIAGALGVDELIVGKLAKVDEGEVFVLRRIDQRRAQVLAVYDQRLKVGSGEELLATIGPAVEHLYGDRPLRAGQKRGVPEEMALRLSPPPLPRWSVYAVGGGTVAAGGIGAFFGVLARGGEQRFNDQMRTAQTQLLPGKSLVDTRNEASRDAMRANYAFAGAGLLALSAGVMALFTDWHGYAEAAARPLP